MTELQGAPYSLHFALHSFYSSEQVANMSINRTPAEEDYPDLTKHNNVMAKKLTKDIYVKMKGKATNSGFDIDKAIQTGVDNPGMFRFHFR